MDYGKTAKEILEKVGGSKNIVSAAHCATRLRLVIADNNKADKGALENIEGVKGVFEASGQLQIILGTGTVNKVFDQFIAIAGITASTKAEAKEAAAKQQNVFMRAIKLLGDIFVPIIPAIVASGFLMGIMNSLDFMINPVCSAIRLIPSCRSSSLFRRRKPLEPILIWARLSA